MFLNLAQVFANQTPPQPRETVFRVHPLQLGRWLDEAWSAVANVPPITGATRDLLGSATIVDDLELPDQPSPPLLVPSGIDPAPGNVDQWTERIGPQSLQRTTRGLMPPHLIYAYLVESSGAFEVFAEVVKQLVNGERLGALTPASIRWLRSTEDLFFRDPPAYSISSVMSELRPHARVNRRQAFWRMFGFDLPHPMPGGVPGSTSSEVWKQTPGIVANTDFRAKWTELLRQVWIGLEYETATAAANPTDASYVALLCKALEDMMNNRRSNGLLAREEFAYVTTLSWFDLTLEAGATNRGTPIVVDLKADGTSPDERLSKLAARVGMQPAARTRELLQLALPVAALMRDIELGVYSTAAKASALLTGATTLTQDMRDIINLWQSATGDRIKDRPVGQPQPVETQPLRIPKPTEMTSANGGRR